MSQVNSILFITLSNIGDCILTLPSLDYLRENFPEARITVLAGPRPEELFQNNPYIDRFIIYDKHSKLREKIKLFYELKAKGFDMVMDLRNSFFGAFLPARYKISPFLLIPGKIRHMKERHLYKLPKVTKGYQRLPKVTGKKCLHISQNDEEYIKNILKERNIKDDDAIILIAPGARSHIKRWPQEKFACLIAALVEEFGVKIILAGDKDDILINKQIAGYLKFPVIDLSAEITLLQLAFLLKRSRLLITNDSAILHLAGYLNVPQIAIFGPTNEAKYGPWSEKSGIVKKEIFCRPCEKAQCRFGTPEPIRQFSDGIRLFLMAFGGVARPRSLPKAHQKPISVLVAEFPDRF